MIHERGNAGVEGLRMARKVAKLTQTDLSLKSGVSRATIARLELNPDISARTDTLKKLALALSCTVDELLKKN